MGKSKNTDSRGKYRDYGNHKKKNKKHNHQKNNGGNDNNSPQPYSEYEIN